MRFLAIASGFVLAFGAVAACGLHTSSEPVPTGADAACSVIDFPPTPPACSGFQVGVVGEVQQCFPAGSATGPACARFCGSSGFFNCFFSGSDAGVTRIQCLERCDAP